MLNKQKIYEYELSITLKLKRLTIIPENVDATTETVDVYSHFAPFVQLYKDFLSRAIPL